ncbi:MAG: hypothetical protein ACKV2O_12050 [Acidimicrobiales bacterium]
MKRDVAQGWWRAADGFWYPPQARPGQLWMGEVRGPHGETPPGPGWWMANDYRWYPPEARPGELWEAPPSFRGIPAFQEGSEAATSLEDLHPEFAFSEEPAGLSAARAEAGSQPGRDAKDEAALLTALGLLLIILGVVLLAGVRLQWPDASAALRLLAWVPVAAGSSLTLIGSTRYLGSPS